MTTIDLKTGITVISMVIAGASAFWTWQQTTANNLDQIRRDIDQLEAKPDKIGVSEERVNELIAAAPKGLDRTSILALLKKEVEGLKVGNSTFPSNVVVASISLCSELGLEWKDYKHGYGRIIVGAGKPNQKQYENSNYPYWNPSHLPSSAENKVKLTNYESEARGGEESVALVKDQLPSHNHKSGDFDSILTADGRGLAPENVRTNLDSARANLTRRGVLAVDGLGESHNNMPPYIALYYCQKS